MRKKKLFRISAAISLLVCLALAYTYAQKNIGGRNSEKESIVKEDFEEAEVPGTPTNDDSWKEMDKLVHAYYGDNGFSYKGSLKLIDDNGEKEKVIEEHSFECAFSKNEFQYLLDSIEVINQGKYVMAVDHRSRIISLSATGKQSQGSQLFDMEQFKKMMVEQKADASVSQSGNEKMLTIDNIQHPQIQGYRIYYDPQTYKINKMLIGMLRFSPLSDEEQSYIENEKPSVNENKTSEAVKSEEDQEETEVDTYSYYVEISYKESHELASGKEFNPLQKIVKISNNKIELQPAFGNYQLLSANAQTE